MRVPRVRLTVRRMLLAVAIVAIMLGMVRMTARLWSDHLLYAERAEYHARFRRHVLQSPESILYWEQRWSGQREGKKASYPWPDGPPFVPAIMEYHDRMRAKWERASRLPWLPIEPDPIE
jgi:hypothetical protein